MIKTFLLSICLVFSSVIFAQTEAENQKTTLFNYVSFLASNDLKGRETGTPGEEAAANFIAAKFKEIGLKPLGEERTYFQTFSFKPKPHPHASEKEMENVEPEFGKNVIAFLDNGAEYTIVLGAHFDHLGEGNHQEGSLYAGDEPMIHNGADDNASGTAVIMMLAEELKSRKDLTNNNYLFIAFSGEEKGLFGSSYFSKNSTISLDQVNYMINLDMVGRYREEKGLAINGTGTSPIWDDRIKKVNKQDITIVSDPSGIGPSDHTSFYLKDIPVLHFFTGQHEDYHKPSDDIDKVNFEGMIMVSNFIKDLIASLNWEGKLEFNETKQENSTKAPKFSVTLGVMPDYVYTGKGMRVDSVIKGRVGDKGGLKNGDVVIKIGDIEVEDIYKYMEGLAKFKKGDTAEVVILRGKKSKKKTLKVIFE